MREKVGREAILNRAPLLTSVSRNRRYVLDKKIIFPRLISDLFIVDQRLRSGEAPVAQAGAAADVEQRRGSISSLFFPFYLS